MRVINVYEAKTHFSKLIDATLKGEEIIIAKNGHPLVKLIPYTEQKPERKGGQLKGMLTISDDFDEPLPEEILEKFYKGND